jgi:serine/threonine-protein kinase
VQNSNPPNLPGYTGEVTIPAGTLVPRDARDFGAYELIAKLATGGMAEIFLARRTAGGVADANEIVVLKRILPHLAEDEHFVTMFRDEARLASRLEHTNVGKVHNLGHVGTTWFIVMEYLHGVPLSRVLTKLAKNRQFLDVRLVASIITQACEGLHHAHELRGIDGSMLGVVHRDVSPPNIFVTDEGVVKLLDFGIAKARGASSKTRTGTVKGKNAYMSPEQILGKPLDRRSDVFALGAVMYELLAVKRLFHRESDFLTFKAITEEPIPDIKDRRPDLPQALRAVLTRALSRDPAGRFTTALEMAKEIRAAVSLQGGPGTPAELATFIAADFAEDLKGKDELVAQAAAAAPAKDPTPASPLASAILAATSSASSANPATAATAPNLPRGRASSSFSDTEELDVIDGELEIEPSREADATRPLRKTDRAQGVMVQDPTPPPPPARAMGSSPKIADGSVPFPVVNTPPPLAAASYNAPSGLGSQMVGLPDPSTDLIQEWRKKRVRNVLIGSAVAAVLLVGGIMLIMLGGSSSPPAQQQQAQAPPPKVVDARVVDPTPDADDRKDMQERARFGYYSITASEKTSIVIDGHAVGDIPLTNWPLAPGVHHVKAYGPHNKVKRFDINIYAAQDTDGGMITW